MWSDSGQVSGPLRPTAALARADRDRMEALRTELEDRHTPKKEILEELRKRLRQK